jgi:hypothetical protein
LTYARRSPKSWGLILCLYFVTLRRPELPVRSLYEGSTRKPSAQRRP